LVDWWLNDFSEKERNLIISKYKSGNKKNTLIETELFATSQTVISFLASMFSNFSKEKMIQQKISKKIYELFDENNQNMILDMHFFFQTKIGFAEKDKENQSYLANLIDACNEQINFANTSLKAFKKEYKNQPLPSHAGYKRLVITLEKEKRYEETIEVCKKALFQKWAGDWEHRIERCENKLNKQNT
jgi:tetratricopeptide (TPR) repeat protein